jgi:uncharacterized repeat protein (TIGR01451 family)
MVFSSLILFVIDFVLTAYLQRVRLFVSENSAACFISIRKGKHKMNKFLNYRRFIVRIIGILPIIMSLGTSKVALAATATSDIALSLVAHRAGDTITYTATMTNLGPDNAVATDVGFTLPDQLKLVSMTCDLGISPDTPFCEYSSLNAGETVVSTLIAKPNLGAQKGNPELTTTASVFFEIDCSFDPNCTFDPDLSNNSASVTMKLTGKP